MPCTLYIISYIELGKIFTVYGGGYEEVITNSMPWKN